VGKAEGSRSLQRIGLLQDLSPADLAKVAGRCAWHRYAANQEVIGQESDNTDVFLIADGKVRVTFFAASGREIAFRDLDAGMSFGELSAIDGLARSASVVALVDTTLASLPRRGFRALLREYPDVAERVMLHLASLVRSLSARVVEFSTLAVQNRIQAELVRMARQSGVASNKAVIAPIPKHADVASRVATNREAVARELNRLAREGLIERQHGGLAVLDVDRLADMVEAVRDI